MCKRAASSVVTEQLEQDVQDTQDVFLFSSFVDFVNITFSSTKRITNTYHLPWALTYVRATDTTRVFLVYRAYLTI